MTGINVVATQLDLVADKYLSSLQSVPDTDYNLKPSPKKWSKKEILGHLVDSAQNNIRRFILVQYESEVKVVYDQDRWVSAANYQTYDLPDLVSLWYLLNKHICRILQNMPPEVGEKIVQTEATHSVAWLASDYLRHLLHHLHQILELEPVAYPAM